MLKRHQTKPSMSSIAPDVPCRVRLDINPTCRPIRWQINVVGGKSIEYTLPIAFREIELSGRACGFCPLIKKGVRATRRDGEPLHRESNNNRIDRDGRIIVQKSALLQIELIHEKNDGKEDVLSGLQFLVANKDDKIWLRPTLNSKPAIHYIPVILAQSWLREMFLH